MSSTYAVLGKPATINRDLVGDEYGLYRFVRKTDNAPRFGDENTLVVVTIGMSMTEFHGTSRISDIQRMIRWAKENTAVRTPTRMVIVTVTGNDLTPGWQRNAIEQVRIADLPTTIVQLYGERKPENLSTRVILHDALVLLKEAPATSEVGLDLDQPMQADLVVSDSSSPAPFTPVVELPPLHLEFAPGGSLFVNRKNFGGNVMSGGQYMTKVWAFEKRWVKHGNELQFTSATELQSSEGQDRLPLRRLL